ncbi:hypothetical protein [Algibacter sp. 2305UL17-15]|uniref:hypothetical protein n=1 Tax=Algibacter sp. 2305UL17-15 TaxID=3231268 RepID=UPI003458D90A
MKKIAVLLITISVFTCGYSQDRTSAKKKNVTTTTNSVVKKNLKVKEPSKFKVIVAKGIQDFHPKYQDVYVKFGRVQVSPLKIDYIEYSPVFNATGSKQKAYYIIVGGATKWKKSSSEYDPKPYMLLSWSFNNYEKYKEVISLLGNRDKDKGKLLLAGASGNYEGYVALLPLGFRDYLQVEE